jgi:hypothetical protein
LLLRLGAFGERIAARLGRGDRWVEGCNGIGRHVAQRLVADGETVVDVPAKPYADPRIPLRMPHRA